MGRQTYSLDEIKAMLEDRLDDLVHRYAPPAQGSYTAFGKYYTLNPGRADRSVGSFYIQMTGARAGKWYDFATKTGGDVLDLIGLAIGRENDAKAQLAEARAYLGLQDRSPAAEAQRKALAERRKAERKRLEAEDKQKATRRADQAVAIFLSAQHQLRGTPVDHYLREARNIDLSRLGRQPGALRYAPRCHYYDIDPDTGEIVQLELPAMLALVTDHRGNQVALHRTYLGRNSKGQWGKANVRQPKKVLGSYSGAAINIWKGTGPRGGKPESLPKCPPDTHVFVAEGIEDALSTAILLPDERVLAAISLGNLGPLKLPKNVSTVTLVADQDEGEQQRQVLKKAIEAHQKAGRTVRLWQNPHGKDLNDALRAAQASAGQEGAA